MHLWSKACLFKGAYGRAREKEQQQAPTGGCASLRVLPSMDRLPAPNNRRKGSLHCRNSWHKPSSRPWPAQTAPANTNSRLSCWPGVLSSTSAQLFGNSAMQSEVMEAMRPLGHPRSARWSSQRKPTFYIKQAPVQQGHLVHPQSLGASTLFKSDFLGAHGSRIITLLASYCIF